VSVRDGGANLGVYLAWWPTVGIVPRLEDCRGSANFQGLRKLHDQRPQLSINFLRRATIDQETLKYTPVMAALVLSLPLPLILLVHLHILEYPHANKSEYDHNIFNGRVRGLRDRIKTLEDICYFIVGRLEGNARTVCHFIRCRT
jgi:hypothetical protein